MIIKIGNIEFQVTLIGQTDKLIENMTIKELQGAAISIYAPMAISPAASPPTPRIKEPTEIEPEEEEDALSTHNTPLETVSLNRGKNRAPEALTPLTGLSLLKQINFSNHTITMIVKRLFGIKAPGESLQENFANIHDATLEWPQRPLHDEIWAVFIGTITPPRLGKRTLAVGLNKANQQVILGMTEKGETDLYENLKRRGLQTNKVKFGMVSFALGATKIFHQYFPQAAVARDWEEFIDMSEDADEQEELKALMLSPDKKEVALALKDFNGPKELLTYFSFDKGLWRVLRTASNIAKIDAELRSHTKDKALIKTKEQLEFVTTWSLLRIQFQWLRIPVDATQFKHFRNIKPMMTVLK